LTELTQDEALDSTYENFALFKSSCEKMYMEFQQKIELLTYRRNTDITKSKIEQYGVYGL